MPRRFAVSISHAAGFGTPVGHCFERGHECVLSQVLGELHITGHP